MTDDKDKEKIEEIVDEVADVLEGDVISPDETEQPDEVELTIEEQLAAEQAKSAEYLDGWKRAMAEADNIRKRFSKLETDMYTNARINIATELLPIIDDFALAMDSVPTSIAADDWYKGLELLPRKLATIVEKIGLEKIESVGAEFDPSVHNAIMQEESDEYESGIVIKQYQAGYKMGDRVIRPAVVVVAA